MAQRIGAFAGMAAALAYLGLRCLMLATVQDGIGSEPLLRIGALLLGSDVLPPEGELDASIVLLSLLVTLGVAAVYGSVLARLFISPSPLRAAARGAVVGAAIYLVHYHLIAPSIFAWFTDAQILPTAVAHVAFGVLLALGVQQTWRKLQP